MPSPVYGIAKIIERGNRPKSIRDRYPETYSRCGPAAQKVVGIGWTRVWCLQTFNTVTNTMGIAYESADDNMFILKESTHSLSMRTQHTRDCR